MDPHAKTPAQLSDSLRGPIEATALRVLICLSCLVDQDWLNLSSRLQGASPGSPSRIFQTHHLARILDC